MSLVRVRGRSMAPALYAGEIVWAGRAHDLKRGDIVLVRKTSLLVKRIIGLPGERIELRSGRVMINNTPLHEPYVLETAYLQPQPDLTVQIPSSYFFVLGDARDDSLDSRRLGTVNVKEIHGVIRRRLWPLGRWGRIAAVWAAIITTGSQGVHAAEVSAHLLAFASENRLTVMIGKYEPSRGWVQATDFYAPPEPGEAFTLYGPEGEVAGVTIDQARLSNRDGVFAGWDAKVSSWDHRSVPYALAVSGRSPFPKPVLEPIPLESPEYRGIVARYLKSRGLRVEEPFLTQAISIPKEGHGREEALLIAHSDASVLSDDKEAAVYAVALLWWNDHGREKVLPLVSQTSFKPAGRRVEDHERLYGTRDFLRLLSAVDIDGDGWKEIALYRAQEGATQIDVFTFDGRRLRRVLSAFKHNYN